MSHARPINELEFSYIARAFKCKRAYSVLCLFFIWIHRQQNQLQHVAFTLGGGQKSPKRCTASGKTSGWVSRKSMSSTVAEKQMGKDAERGRTWRRWTMWKNPWSVAQHELWGRTTEGRGFLWSPSEDLRQERRSSAVRGNTVAHLPARIQTMRKFKAAGTQLGKEKVGPSPTE